jgi:hypothetical protein
METIKAIRQIGGKSGYVIRDIRSEKKVNEMLIGIVK